MLISNMLRCLPTGFNYAEISNLFIRARISSWEHLESRFDRCLQQANFDWTLELATYRPFSLTNKSKESSDTFHVFDINLEDKNKPSFWIKSILFRHN